MSRLFTSAQLAAITARKRVYNRRYHMQEPRDPSVPAAVSHRNKAMRERARDHAFVLALIAEQKRRDDVLRAFAMSKFQDFEEVPIGENRELLARSH